MSEKVEPTEDRDARPDRDFPDLEQRVFEIDNALPRAERRARLDRAIKEFLAEQEAKTETEEQS